MSTPMRRGQLRTKECIIQNRVSAHTRTCVIVDTCARANDRAFVFGSSDGGELPYMKARWRIWPMLFIACFLPGLFAGQKFHTYIGQIGATSALIAWGT